MYKFVYLGPFSGFVLSLVIFKVITGNTLHGTTCPVCALPFEFIYTNFVVLSFCQFGLRNICMCCTIFIV